MVVPRSPTKDREVSFRVNGADQQGAGQHSKHETGPNSNKERQSTSSSSDTSTQEAALLLIRHRKDSKPNRGKQSAHCGPQNFRIPKKQSASQEAAAGNGGPQRRNSHEEGRAKGGGSSKDRFDRAGNGAIDRGRVDDIAKRLKDEARRMGELQAAARHRGSADEERLVPGDRVSLRGSRQATVMFVGPAPFAPPGDTIVGLALDTRRSNSANDGVAEGRRYFRCKPGHALFVDAAEAKPVPDAFGPAPLYLETELRGLVGCETAKEALRSIRDGLEVNERRAAAGASAEPCPHLAVAGPPGSGASTWGRVAARLAHTSDCTRKGRLVLLSARPGAGLVSSSRSATAEAVLQAVQDAAGGVMFVDDAHELAPSNSASADSGGKDALEALMRETERQREAPPAEAFVLVLAGEAAGVDSVLRSGLGEALGIHTGRSRSSPRNDPRYIQLTGFAAEEAPKLLSALAASKGFKVDPATLRSPKLARAIEDACRRSPKGRLGARQVAALLQSAISRQTRRVHASMTVTKDSLTALLEEDFEDRHGREAHQQAATAGGGRWSDGGRGSPLEQLDGVVGLSEVKTFVRSLQAQLLVDERRRQSGLPSLSSGTLHMVFAGNPGTGKTTVARIVSALLAEMGILSAGHLVEADRASLVAGYVGQTAIKVSNVVREALGGILFVDEAYALVQGDRDSFGREALDTLMKLMEDHRDELVVVFAGYSREIEALLSSNPGLRSRFPTVITFHNYTAAELMSICSGMLASEQLVLTPGATEIIQAALEQVAERADKGSCASAPAIWPFPPEPRAVLVAPCPFSGSEGRAAPPRLTAART